MQVLCVLVTQEYPKNAIVQMRNMCVSSFVVVLAAYSLMMKAFSPHDVAV